MLSWGLSKYIETTQQTFVGLQDVFSVTIFRLPTRLEDISYNVLKTSWMTKNCYDEDVLKTCLEDVLNTCLEDVLKTCLENIFKTSWRQKKKKMGISVSHKSKCVCIWQVYISQIYIWRTQGESKIINWNPIISKLVCFEIQAAI